MSDIPGFKCTDCGKCCLEGAGQLQATQADIALWETEAPHLFDFVNVHGEPGNRTGDLWSAPGEKRNTTRCKWIRKYPGRDQYYCRIYEWRPEVCRKYPISRQHARLTECPGI